MGANTSQPTDEENMKAFEDKTAFVDKALTNNIEGLNTILTQFSKNDTQGIINKIKSMPEFKGQIPDKILNRVSDVHKSILDTLDSSLSAEDRQKQLEGDGNIAKVIQAYVDKELDDKMSEYLENPFIKNDPIVKKSMFSVTNSIKTVRGKYKYFEYKYVQMNVFLILFTKHVHTTIKKFIDESSAFYAAREKYHLVLIHNVIKIFEEQLGAETKNLSDLDTQQFSSAIKELTQSVMDSITQQKQLGEKMKEDSLADILKFLMEKETDFASEIIKSVDSYKDSNPQKPSLQPSQSPSPTSPTFGPSVKPDFIPAQAFQGNKPGYKYTTDSQGLGYYDNSGQKGGFIRDGSKLPQNFFDL